ncbi:autotransporter assembly complex family protein [Mesorhizobium sp. CN2-181]|uniref:autotransporter assembly complex protein TamA n=1 Tax=Mesorhizobium yinganensis TaxID=3157707 RepID=UPI0032B85093
MMKRQPQSWRGETATVRFARFFLSGLLCTTALVALTPRADAFQIFGYKFFEKENEEDADIADPLHYTVTVEVAGSDDLKKKISDASSLVADEDRPVSGSLGLLTKARGDRERLVAALYEAARYDGVVDILIAGKSIDVLPPDAEFGAGPVPVTISVEPGQTFVLGDVQLKGDAAGLAPADFGLTPGGDAGSTRILKAESDVVKRLKAEGRPLAKVTGREVIADHKTGTVDVSLAVAAGPVADYGPTTVSGTETMDSGFTGYMAGLEQGKRYSPEEMDEARDRLNGLGVFNSVAVMEADALDANGNIPINVTVTERKLRYYGVGATYSNTEGIGLEGYWGHRNLFGHAEKLRIEGSISGIGSNEFTALNYNAGIMFEKPGVIGPASKFFSSLKSVYEHPDAYDRFSVEGTAGLAYQLTKTQSVSAELDVEFSRITDAFVTNQDYLIVSTPLQYAFDNRDNKLNPTKGFRAVGYVEPAYDVLNSVAFVKLRGEGSAYQALDSEGRIVVAGRAVLGSIVGASVEQVPADRRFYAGGGGSVRGYAYQGIGPREDGEPTGGLSLAEGSVELRYAVNDTFGIVPFVDAGTVSLDSYPDFADVKVGAGIGIRYMTPFGPLRVDAAVPLNPDSHDPSFAVYAGIGQSF